MKCPRCDSALIVVEYHDIELDWCPGCEGLWFDSGEIELVAARSGGARGLTTSGPAAATGEKSLKCPECRRTMKKRLLGNVHPVIADVCPSCEGIWLDHGELEQVVSQQQDRTKPISPIIEHLRGTFPAGPNAGAKPLETLSGDSSK